MNDALPVSPYPRTTHARRALRDGAELVRVRRGLDRGPLHAPTATKANGTLGRRVRVAPYATEPSS